MKTSLPTHAHWFLRRFILNCLPCISAGRRFNCLLILLACLFMPLTVVRADVSLTLQIWHGYDFYYPSVDLNASNPDPVTYDRVESPSGLIWKNFGTNNDSNPFFLTNNLDALLAEFNGSWKLYVNKEDGSEQLYHFTVSITGVTTNVLGDVTILFPESGSSEVTNRPMFYWMGPTNLAELSVNAYSETDMGNSYYESLPVTATNWTPSGPLTPGDNEFYVNYSSNNFAGFSFTVPTNSSGTLSGWTAEGDVFTYLLNNFSVMANASGGGSGGHTNLAYYSFENGDIFATDYSPNGNNVSSISSFGGGTAYTTNDQTIGDYAAFFSDNGGSGASWLTPPTNLLTALAGSFSISLWVKTTQATGSDDDDGLYGNAGLVSAFNGPGGNWVVPMAITGNKLAFVTGGSPQFTLHSTTDINTGSYVHLVVTRNQSTGEKRIYVNGALDAMETGSTDLLDTPTELSIGYNNGTGFDGRMDEIQIYSGVLSASEVLQLHNNPGTAIPDTTGSGGGLVAHYDFDENTALAADVSGNGNDLVYAGNFGGNGPGTNPEHIGAAGGSAYFDGGSYLSAPASLLPTLAGSFTISFWVKTTQNNGDPGDLAWTGDAILSADIPYSANDLIPAALTGGQVAFNTANTEYNYDDTINSSATVNDGEWHHVVVSRNQPAGTKFIYIDGVLDTSDTDATTLLNDPQLLTIGCKSDASDSDPSSPDYNGSNGYEGLLDDIQIYSRVLGSSEVTFLYDNPGSVITGGNDFNAALNTTDLTWNTGGDASWFTENSITHDGDSAAQSGIITDNEASYIETTVPADGNISFYWKVSSEAGFDFLTFYINGNEQDAISGDDGDWNQQAYSVSAGDTLRWEYSKDGSGNAGLDAGFLDELTYIPVPPDTNTIPVITVNPFNQTNSPGYNVSLYAAATSNPTATWQWFKVDSGAVAGATNALYIPTNSGTAGVAGSYFAVASNFVGSATTLTATVAFVSAPLPPDWTVAYKTQVTNNLTDATTNYNIACLLDSAGNIYTVGSINGTNTFGSDSLISINGQFGSSFLKQTATGTPIWGRCMTNNGNGSSYAQSVATAPGGGIYVSGVIFGTNWLGTNQLVDTAGGVSYLARFDANGSNQWVRLITGTNFNFTTYHQLVSDPEGNVTLSALIWGATSFGTTNLFTDGQRGVLVQYDASGNVRWIQAPSGWPDYLTYSAGRIYGSMGGGSPYYVGGITNVSDRRHALFALNATNGEGLWIRGVAAQQDQGPPVFGNDDALVAVSGTNVFIAGNAWGSNAVFGPFTVNFPASEGQYLARFDTNGNAQLATSFGSQYTWLWTIKADASGNVYVGGDFDTYSVFGNNIIAAPFYETIQSVGGIENRIPGQTFVAKFDRNVNPLWARLARSDSSYVNSRDLALAPDGVWSCGLFNPIGVFGTNIISGGITVISSPFDTIYYHPSGYLAKITDGAAMALPVALLNPQNNGTNFQFQFLSQSGFNHAVLYRTNLALGNDWQTYSNVTGDGVLKTIPVPMSIFSPAKQGFIRVSTQ